MKSLQKTIIVILLFISLSLNVFAAGNTITMSVSGYPGSLAANQGLSTVLSLSDSGNKTLNYTALLYVNNVNTANVTGTNVNANGTQTYTIGFTEDNWLKGDSVFVNYTARETLNTSVSNYTTSATLTVLQSTTVLVAADTLDGLGSAGGFIGDFMGNLSPGLFKFLLLIGLAVALIGLLTAILYVIHKKGGFN